MNKTNWCTSVLAMPRPTLHAALAGQHILMERSVRSVPEDGSLLCSSMPSFALRELVVKHCSSGGSGLRAHVHDVGSPQGHHRRSSASRIRKESDQRQDGDHFGCKCCCCSCSSLRRCCCSCRSCSCCSSIWCCGGLARSRWAGGGCGGSFGVLHGSTLEPCPCSP